MSDHDDQDPGELPEPIDLDAHRNRIEFPDRSGEPIRDGYRVLDSVLYGPNGKPRCSAKARKAPGGICHSSPVKNQKRCRMHGGTSPQAKKRESRERVHEELQGMVSQFDMGPVHDPLNALKAIAGEVIAWKDAMRVKVEELDSLEYSTDYGETARAIVQLFERAMDRAGDFLFKIARLNIDERLAAVTERQLAMIEEGFFAALDEAGVPVLNLDTREKCAVAFAKHLSVIPA